MESWIYPSRKSLLVDWWLERRRINADVFLAVLSAYLGAWFSKRMGAEKKKTPKRPGKHFKRS